MTTSTMQIYYDYYSKDNEALDRIIVNDLYADGIGDTIEGMVREMLAGKGAVRNTLRKYLG